MALHRLTALALTGVLALSASGCGGDSPSPSPRTSSAAASPTPTSSGPAAPVLPDIAARHDDVGAKAFVKYWFTVVTYAMHTGDADSIGTVSTNNCQTCANLTKRIRHLRHEGGHVEGGGWTVGGINEGADRADSSRIYRLFVEQPKQSLFDRSGDRVSVTARTGFTADAVVVWRGGWKMRELAKL